MRQSGQSKGTGLRFEIAARQLLFVITEHYRDGLTATDRPTGLGRAGGTKAEVNSGSTLPVDAVAGLAHLLSSDRPSGRNKVHFVASSHLTRLLSPRAIKGSAVPFRVG